jgi:DNA-binding MarR family transcriptional regulator
MDSKPTNDLDRFEAALRLFGKTMKRQQSWQVITAKAKIDIDQPAAGILMALNARESHTCRIHELATHLGVEAPSVTRKVQQLEQAGLVARQQDASDKRAFDIKITPRGEVVVKKLHEAHLQIIREVLDAWSAEERRQFVTLFEQFSKQLGDVYNVHQNSKTSKGSENG